MTITRKSEGISLSGRMGKWYCIDSRKHHGIEMFLMEHETYGDEAAAIIVKGDGTIILEDVWNGLDDLDYLGG